MTLVIKVSGKVVESPKTLRAVCQQIVQHRSSVVVVHGGGMQMDALASQLQVRQKIVQGRRITDEKTLELACMAFAGRSNLTLCSALMKVGGRPIGINGSSGGVIKAKKRPPMLTDKGKTDFGFVGDMTEVDCRGLNSLIQEGFIPVISSLACTSHGQILNVNADLVACGLASALKAECLTLLSDVAGVYADPDNPNSRFDKLALPQLQALLKNGVAKGGMHVKLQACQEALNQGLKKIIISEGLEWAKLPDDPNHATELYC